MNMGAWYNEKYNFLISNIQSTNRNLTNMSGILTSPDFPHNYGFEHDCTWIISVPIGHHILLSFDMGDFNIHPCNKSCACDFLEVRAGTTSKGKFIGKFCGATPPSPIYVSGRETWLRFVTNKLTNNKGFRTTYKAIRSLAGKCTYQYFESQSSLIYICPIISHSSYQSVVHQRCVSAMID